jgi:alpha-tubulin suppressor-like RCC1 family protein
MMGARHLSGFALVIGLLLGCTSIEEPRLQGFEEQEELRGIIVSNVTSVLFAAGPDVGESRAGFAYVSMSPGTAPAGERVIATNLTTGIVREGALRDGGFDPIPVPASAGDTLEIVIHGPDGVIIYARAMVKSKKRPIVVRSDPPKGKRDVPLNVTSFIVFSEPMDPATVTSQTLQLLHVGEPVQGNAALSADGLRAEFTPAELLRPETVYVLHVSDEVADRQGDRLEAPLDVEFTTGPAMAQAAAVEVSPASATILPGTRIQLEVMITDAGGSLLTLADQRVVWSYSGLEVDGGARVTGVREGTFSVTVTADGASGTAVIVVASAPFAWVGGGEFHTCAQTTTGALYCWGNNYLGHLGFPPSRSDGCDLYVDGDPISGDPSCSQTPGLVPAELRFTTLSGGMYYRCGLADGTAHCWGRNNSGALGTGSRASSHLPAPVAGGFRFTSIAAGWSHTCGVASDGRAYCWGGGDYGALGSGSEADQFYPTAVAGGLTFSMVATRMIHTCALTTAGVAYCWGWNEFGQLGNGRRRDASSVPDSVLTDLRFSSITTGFDHSCGLTSEGTAYCWGDNQVGQLGTGARTVPQHHPVPVSGDLTLISIGAGAYHTCGLSASGTAYCWGHSVHGTTTPQWAPTRVAGGLAFSALSVGSHHSCGLTQDGHLYCWGDNCAGQIGDGTSDFRPEPARIPAQPVALPAPPPN